MLKIYIETLKNFSFKGRATRKEYFAFALFQLLVIVFISFAAKPFGNAVFFLAYFGYILLTTVQGLAIAVRRLHDISLSGWFLILCFVPFVGVFFGLYLMIKGSSEGENIYNQVSVIAETKTHKPLLPS